MRWMVIFHPSSGAVLDEVNTGTRLVGITNEGMARQQILEGEDLVMTYPTDGTSAIPDATAIVKGNETFRECTVISEFTVSSDVQRLVEEAFLENCPQ